MKIIKFLSLSLLMLSFALIDTSAFAQKKKKRKGKKKKKSAKTEEVYNYPYGMAGCGLGSLVIKENTMMGQMSASTLNSTGYQTLAITTGTSNCEMQKADMARLEQEVFVEVNLASLSKDAAKGDGRYLRAMAEILGCTDRYEAFASLSRERYQELFATGEPKVVLSSYLGALAQNETFDGSCVRAL